MIPRLAALSSAEIRARPLFGSLSPVAVAMAFCIFRKRVRTVRLRRLRAAVCRARFEADLVLAMSGDYERKNWAGRLAESARFVKLPLAGPRLRGRTLSAARAGHVAAGSGTLLLHGRCGLAGAKRGGPTNFHGGIGRAILINHFRLGDSRQTVRHDLHHGA